LGNDSKLALSTGNIGINTTTPDIFGRFYTYSLGIDSSGSTALQIDGTSYSTIDMGANGVRLGFLSQSATEISLGNLSTIPLTFQTNSAERMRITDTGNVGIGTSSPSRRLTVFTPSGIAGEFRNETTAASLNAGYGLIVQSEASAASSYCAVFRDLAESQTYMVIKTETGQDGYVGINTFNPAVHLDVVGQVRANSGILFGTDTAAANALDDYEEGTWTPTITDGTTTKTGTAQYTKIGRQVSVQGFISNVADPSTFTGSVYITGSPFTPNGEYPISSIVNAAATSKIWSAVFGSDTVIRFYRVNDSTANFSQIQGSDFVTETDIYFAGTFNV
jgi:hypothetical protein